MKFKFFVPIKLNSQRLPKKMELPLGNKLLCQHIFDSLLIVKQKLTNIDLDIYCFCSDPKIKNLLPEGVLYLKRNSNLDLNETKGLDIYQSFINIINDGDVYGIFHATSPFLKPESIINGINAILNNNYDSALTVSRIQTFSWFNNKPLNYELDNIIRTQDITPVFYETSAFFLFKKNILLNKSRRIGDNPYFVETDRIESIDIDEKQDYELALKIIN